MQQSNVFNLFFKCSRFTSTCKSSEPCTTASQGPAGYRYLEVSKLFYNSFSIQQTICNKFEFPLMLFHQWFIVFLNFSFFNIHSHFYFKALPYPTNITELNIAIIPIVM